MALGYAFAHGAKKKKKVRKKKATPKPIVQVKTMTGKVVLEAQGDLSISDVKLKIYEKHGIPLEDQKFLYQGEIVSEPDETTATIDKYNPVTFVSLGRSYMEQWELEQDERFSGYLGYS